jgi:hypothetical protein
MAASNKTPTKVKQAVFNTDEISRQADPDWVKDRNYGPAYKFNQGKRKFVDHRNKVYDHPAADE